MPSALWLLHTPTLKAKQVRQYSFILLDGTRERLTWVVWKVSFQPRHECKAISSVLLLMVMPVSHEGIQVLVASRGGLNVSKFPYNVKARRD